MIHVRLEPQGREMRLPKACTALKLLQVLGLGINSALVIRDGELLTPDRRLNLGDEIVVRTVASRG